MNTLLPSDRRTRFYGTGVLLATLILGVLLGALLTGAVIRHRVAERSALLTPKGLAAYVEAAAGAETEAQRGAIREAAARAAPAVRATFRRARAEMEATVNQLRADLEPALSDEQMARLDERLERLSARDGERRPFRDRPFRDRPFRDRLR
jgi:hypothetical protein